MLSCRHWSVPLGWFWDWRGEEERESAFLFLSFFFLEVGVGMGVIILVVKVCLFVSQQDEEALRAGDSMCFHNTQPSTLEP